MKAVERLIGITVGTILLAAGPALAAPAWHSAVIGWSTADALAAQRVPGGILVTRLDSARVLYNVDIVTADKRLEDVEVDAHNPGVVGVHRVTEPGLIGEIEAP